jgi:hypothetical protein
MSIDLSPDILRKHIGRLIEARVKAHTRTSKKGKTFNVRQHERDVSSMTDEQLMSVINSALDREGNVRGDPVAMAATNELQKRSLKREGNVFNIHTGGKQKRTYWVPIGGDPAAQDVMKRFLAKGKPEKMLLGDFRKKYKRGVVI